jgi:TetR/AcrR family transcriptional regulator, mexCD-oprJ operon repressor
MVAGVSVAQTREDRTTAVVLEAAVAVLAEKGDAATMADVAERSGLSRATLYNYFKSRELLLSALGKAAVDAAYERIVEADLDSVTVPEALARMTRALVASGMKFFLVMSARCLDRDDAERRLSPPMRRVFQRGIDDGTFRSDYSSEMLQTLYRGLLLGILRLVGETQIGVEQASSIVIDFFMEGSRARAARS